MREIFKNMNYDEFKEWCNDRACDGQWNVDEAMLYIPIMRAIDEIKIKGLFKKKATKEARELAWRDIFEK